MPHETQANPWEKLRSLIATNDGRALADFLDKIGPSETARSISRLEQAEQARLITLLAPAEAAEVIEDVTMAQAVDLIADLSAEDAAAIVGELESDHQADLLGDLSTESAEAILGVMRPEEARDARHLLSYPPDTAGGIMVTEFVAFREGDRVSDALASMQENREVYADYHVQYLYVCDDGDRLKGVLRIRDLLYAPREAPLESLMITNPLTVPATAKLEDLERFFDQHHLLGAPVLDDLGELVGLVLPEDVGEAGRKRSDRQLLDISGIVGGEEFRGMSLGLRSRRRLSWLSINIFLNVIAASVIAYYQDTLAAAIALAVFLPMISDMSGCSGNQAVAVSIRELTLGLVRPEEVLRVLGKEVSLGAINGLVLGAILGGVAWLWKGNIYLALVVGGALLVNTVLAVALGGLLPLVLKTLRFDPALVSGPILTTVTDMAGFFLVLSMATLVLPKLAIG
ncbi:MAG: magnesium transporter [Deltaproteobacteria bacterium]|nr:magnesium transporter [Deltaproteobacteria bacterium]